MEPVVIGFLIYLDHQVCQYLRVALLELEDHLLKPSWDSTGHKFLNDYLEDTKIISLMILRGYSATWFIEVKFVMSSKSYFLTTTSSSVIAIVVIWFLRVFLRTKAAMYRVFTSNCKSWTALVNKAKIPLFYDYWTLVLINCSSDSSCVESVILLWSSDLSSV